MNKKYGPTVPFCSELHASKYRSEGEDFEGSVNRVASALKDSDEHFQSLREMLLEMRFMPGGRVQTAIGSNKNVTPHNCFVIPVEDSFVDGPNSIMEAAKNAAATMRMGGGVGYDFSRLRPRGDLIKKLLSQSSGPISFMEIFDAVCRCTASSGHRRGAQMGILRVDHPSIEEFIGAKTNEGKLEGFNLSIAITDAFMEAVRDEKQFPLQFEGRVYKYIDAVELWNRIMRNTWDWAEPGVVFIDTINRMNNLWYCEKLEATNPCAEQPLPNFGNCLLGSFNLVKYIQVNKCETESDRLLCAIFGKFSFNWEQLEHDIPVAVRAMDNVIDQAIYPLPQQREEATAKRRMGLGICGLANAGEALGYPYGSQEFLEFEERVMFELTNGLYSASADLAVEKGSFPLYDADKYLIGNFIKTLAPGVQDKIRKCGIRNSHLSSLAPTGTIAFCADNVSGCIEPVFDYSFDRTVMEFDGPRTETIEDYGVRVFGVRGKRCRDVTAKEHVDVLVTAQRFVDSAVSKTCNVSPDMPWEEFKHIYFDAWERGAKGCTTFNPKGKRRGVLVSKEEEQPQSCKLDPVTGKRDCE